LKGAVRDMNVRPLGEKVLLKRVAAEGKTAGGIVLPDTAKEKPKEGKVIAIGDGRILKSGERVKFQEKRATGYYSVLTAVPK